MTTPKKKESEGSSLGRKSEETAGRAYDRALIYLQYRARSSGELKDRLYRYGYDGATVDEVIERLRQVNLIDDDEFARHFMGELIERGLGFHGVRAKLIAKRLDRSVIEDVMKDYPLDGELNRACMMLKERAACLKDAKGEAGYNRLRGFLLRRGYAADVADHACRAVLKDGEAATGATDRVDTALSSE